MYKCVKGHFTNKEHDGKNCPYDNMSASELSEELKIDLGEIDYINLENHYNWAVEHDYVSPLVSYELYKRTAESLYRVAIGKIAADGTKIKRITNHCIDRVCGTIKKENGIKHEGVTLEDFEDTLFNGEVMNRRETDNKIYIVGKCIITVNPIEGAIKQCNKIT